MSSVILHQVGQVAVGLRRVDGYINATAMTAAHKLRTGQRRDVHNWLSTKRTGETLQHLSGVTGIPVTDLVVIVQGGIPENQGTWIHPRLAVRFGMWLSDDFGLTVEDWVQEWKLPAASTRAVLPCHIEAVEKAKAIRQITDSLDDNPRLAQILVAHAINDIIEQKKLTDTASELRGVAEIAIEMGYSLDASSRVKLGSFMATQGFESKKDSRLCNGVKAKINCYADTPDLRQAIQRFFER